MKKFTKITSMLLISMLPLMTINTVQANTSHTPSTKISKMALIHQATAIQMNLSQGNFNNIAQYIHPKKGVQFSMYAYIQPKKDKRFSRQQFLTYLKKSKIKFTWGEYDSIEKKLITTLPKYLTEWVEAKKFDNGIVSVNDFKGFGNSLNNLEKIYPHNKGYQMVEFYDKGSKKYDGMDWRVMRLVFEEYQGRYYLVAIVTDMWTI